MVFWREIGLAWKPAGTIRKDTRRLEADATGGPLPLACLLSGLAMTDNSGGVWRRRASLGPRRTLWRESQVPTELPALRGRAAGSWRSRSVRSWNQSRRPQFGELAARATRENRMASQAAKRSLRPVTVLRLRVAWIPFVFRSLKTLVP